MSFKIICFFFLITFLNYSCAIETEPSLENVTVPMVLVSDARSYWVHHRAIICQWFIDDWLYSNGGNETREVMEKCSTDPNIPIKADCKFDPQFTKELRKINELNDTTVCVFTLISDCNFTKSELIQEDIESWEENGYFLLICLLDETTNELVNPEAFEKIRDLWLIDENKTEILFFNDSNFLSGLDNFIPRIQSYVTKRPTSPIPEYKTDDDQVDINVIIGSIVGCIVVGVLFGALVFIVLKRRRHRRSSDVQQKEVDILLKIAKERAKVKQPGSPSSSDISSHPSDESEKSVEANIQSVKSTTGSKTVGKSKSTTDKSATVGKKVGESKLGTDRSTTVGKKLEKANSTLMEIK